MGHPAGAGVRDAPTRSRMTWGPRSTLSRWSSGTRGSDPPRPGSASRATRSMVRPGVWGEFLDQRSRRGRGRRHRTPGRSPMQDHLPEAFEALSTPCAALKSTTRTRRTSSSRSRPAASTSCRPEPASGTATSATRIAVDMVEEGLLTAAEAVMRIRPGAVRKTAAPDDRSLRGDLRGCGQRAERLTGSRSGRSSFDADIAEERACGRRRDPRAARNDAGRYPRACSGPRGSSLPAAA